MWWVVEGEDVMALEGVGVVVVGWTWVECLL